MSEVTQPLDNEAAIAEAARHKLARSPEAQLLAAIIRQLRTRPHPWWSPENLRRSWPTSMRFDWLASRPDVRGRITHELTRITPAAARNLERAIQVQIIDAASDVTPQQYELAFEPEELALHAPAPAIWQEFRSRFPWGAPRTEDLEFFGWLIKTLMAPRSDGQPPLMSALYVRAAIDARVWQENLPIEVRIQADARRLQLELAGRRFSAEDELAIVRVERIVQFIPTKHLESVLDGLEHQLPGLVGVADEPVDLDPGELEPVDAE